jgi:hypothetical protein
MGAALTHSFDWPIFGLRIPSPVIRPKFLEVPMFFNLTKLTLTTAPVTLNEGLEILERDQHRCRYCGLDGNASFENALAMSVDFVKPRARKGKKDPNNLVACCRTCNAIKGKKVYDSFEAAKKHVLAQRAELRKTWEENNKQRPGKP